MDWSDVKKRIEQEMEIRTSSFQTALESYQDEIARARKKELSLHIEEQKAALQKLWQPKLDALDHYQQLGELIESQAAELGKECERLRNAQSQAKSS